MKIETVEKLRRCFESMAVYKDLKKNNVFSTLGLPSFMRDWLLQKFENDDGLFDTDTLKDFVKTFIPKRDDWTEIKNRLVINYEQVKILAKILIDINIVTGVVSIAVQEVWTLGAITFALKNAKGHMTMRMVQSMEDTNQDRLDRGFTMLLKRLENFSEYFSPLFSEVLLF